MFDLKVSHASAHCYKEDRLHTRTEAHPFTTFESSGQQGCTWRSSAAFCQSAPLKTEDLVAETGTITAVTKARPLSAKRPLLLLTVSINLQVSGNFSRKLCKKRKQVTLWEESISFLLFFCLSVEAYCNDHRNKEMLRIIVGEKSQILNVGPWNEP